MAKFRSLISGAIGDAGFEPGDLIDVPDNKVDEWLDAGLIEPANLFKTDKAPRPVKVVEIFATDGAVAGDVAR